MKLVVRNWFIYLSDYKDLLFLAKLIIIYFTHSNIVSSQSIFFSTSFWLKNSLLPRIASFETWVGTLNYFKLLNQSDLKLINYYIWIIRVLFLSVLINYKKSY